MTANVEEDEREDGEGLLGELIEGCSGYEGGDMGTDFVAIGGLGDRKHGIVII